MPLNKSFEQIDKCFEQVEKHFKGVDGSLMNLEAKLDVKMNGGEARSH